MRYSGHLAHPNPIATCMKILQSRMEWVWGYFQKLESGLGGYGFYTNPSRPTPPHPKCEKKKKLYSNISLNI